MATTKKKTTKKKTTKKKVAKKIEPKETDVLTLRINSESLKGIIKIKEATVIFRALALLQEVVRRQELGYDLCFLEKTTQKLVSVNLGGPKDAGGP